MVLCPLEYHACNHGFFQSVIRDYRFIYPQYLDQNLFYFSLDAHMVVELIKTQLAYLKTNWKQMGRPTFPIPVLHSMIGKLVLLSCTSKHSFCSNIL